MSSDVPALQPAPAAHTSVSVAAERTRRIPVGRSPAADRCADCPLKARSRRSCWCPAKIRGQPLVGGRSSACHIHARRHRTGERCGFEARSARTSTTDRDALAPQPPTGTIECRAGVVSRLAALAPQPPTAAALAPQPPSKGLGTPGSCLDQLLDQRTGPDMQKSPPERGLLRDDVAGARQALGRLPWFAPFFLRARRLRPVLPMVVLLESVLGAVSQIRTGAANRVEPGLRSRPR